MGASDDDETPKDAEAYARELAALEIAQNDARRLKMAALVKELLESERSPDAVMQFALAALCRKLSETDYKRTLFNIVTRTIEACATQLRSKLEDISIVTAEDRARLKTGIKAAMNLVGTLTAVLNGINPFRDGERTGGYTDDLIRKIKKLKNDCSDRQSSCVEDVQLFIGLIKNRLWFCVDAMEICEAKFHRNVVQPEPGHVTDRELGALLVQLGARARKCK
jgi:hypothetical protein